MRIQLGTSGTPNANYCLVYNYYVGVANPTTCTGTPGTATSGNNGNVMGYFYQDTTNPSLGHTVAYGYDALNRLTSAAATGSSTYSFTFSYDRFGNMTCNATNGQCASLSFPPNNGSTTNRTTTSGYSWDAAGNLVQDPSAANPAYGYQWDAEGRLATITQGANTNSTSTYNANGQVVENVYPGLNAKVEGLFDPWGQELGYYNGVGNAWWDRDIRLGGRMFAQSFPSATYFLHADHLGSDSQITDQSGAFKADFLYYPWQNWKYAGNMVDAHFAGFQQSGGANYPTPTRLYSGGQGRWLSPDPVAGDITNPQSLNRYAYALNNPTTLIDPLGLQEKCTIANGCKDPHVVWREPGLAFDFGNCTLDYVPINCGSLLRAIQGGITNVSPISISGNTVTSQTVQCQYVNEANPAVCSSGVATFTLGSGDSTPSWWGTFFSSFIKNFSLQGAKQPGESFGACVNRVESALFGGAAPLVNALGPPVAVVSGATSIFTTSPATAALPGNVINIATGRQATTALPSLLERILPEAVAAGTVSTETAAAVEAVVPVISKVAAPVTALSWGLVGGIWGSCR